MVQLLCQTVTRLRPLGYLGNNESHDGCMLIALHENANKWYLFLGDGGVIDILLNKTMIAVDDSGRWMAPLLRGSFRPAAGYDLCGIPERD